MPVPTAERPPEGLNDAYWLGVWRHVLKVLKEQGTWKWEQRPLLDEYVFALREAVTAREMAQEDPYHETDKQLLHPHPGFQQADRATRRAVVLADTILLTEKSRREHGLVDEEAPDATSEGDQAGL